MNNFKESRSIYGTTVKLYTNSLPRIIFPLTNMHLRNTIAKICLIKKYVLSLDGKSGFSAVETLLET